MPGIDLTKKQETSGGLLPGGMSEILTISEGCWGCSNTEKLDTWTWDAEKNDYYSEHIEDYLGESFSLVQEYDPPRIITGYGELPQYVQHNDSGFTTAPHYAVCLCTKGIDLDDFVSFILQHENMSTHEVDAFDFWNSAFCLGIKDSSGDFTQNYKYDLGVLNHWSVGNRAPGSTKPMLMLEGVITDISSGICLDNYKATLTNNQVDAYIQDLLQYKSSHFCPAYVHPWTAAQIASSNVPQNIGQEYICRNIKEIMVLGDGW